MLTREVRKRRGKIRVSIDLWENPVFRAQLVTYMLPVHIFIEGIHESVDIFGYSDHFEELPEGAEAPYYTMPPDMSFKVTSGLV